MTKLDLGYGQQAAVRFTAHGISTFGRIAASASLYHPSCYYYYYVLPFLVFGRLMAGLSVFCNLVFSR